MDDLLKSLRLATGALHKQLDELVPAFHPASSQAAYTEYLRSFHAGLSSCWPLLDWTRLEALGLPDAARRKARYEAIRGDLGVLGSGVPPFEVFTGSPDPAIVGCLYVLEGSVHGGSHLFARMGESATGIPAGAYGFIEGFGPDNKRLWVSFVQWMGSLEHSPGFIAEAGDSAVRAFEGFIESFKLREL